MADEEQLVPGEDDQDMPDALTKSLETLQLPFPVATITDLEQRAYMTAGGSSEWLFSRAHVFCQIGTDPGRYLRNNKSTIEGEMLTFQVPQGQFHYRGKDIEEEGGNQWKDHTFESRAFFVVLLSLLRKALKLVLGLAEKAFQVMDVSAPFMALITQRNGTMVARELYFSAQGVCHTFGEFIRLCPGAAALWPKLTSRCWLNRCIASSSESPAFLDLWFFLVYLYCHPKLKVLGQNIWLCLGIHLLMELVQRTGDALTQAAHQASREALKMLPTLRTKAGFIRKMADPVNRVLLLLKLEKEKQHRRRIASTHRELGGASNRMIVFENYMDCLLHLKALQNGCSGCKQLSCSWDPSSYGGKDIMMAIMYDPFLDRAAYLMCQHMTQTMLSELHTSLLPAAKGRKLLRLEGFKEIKGLSSALASIGLSLVDFQVPSGLLCRPLIANEFRLEATDGSFWRKDVDTNALVPEVPPGMDLSSLPCLVSISDQGPNIIGATNYLQYSKNALMFLSLFDPFHRAWNDLKGALKAAKSSAWRTVLELTLVANLNYGPFGSSTWHFKKKSRLEDFCATKNCFDEIWVKYQHLICKEKKIPEPSNVDDSQALFDSLRSLDSFATKGPLIKLMRWFSWFESMVFYSGELWMTKMVLESAMDHTDQGSEQEVEEKPLTGHKDHQKELQELKRRKGSWKLAPQLINHKNMAVKDCIMSVGKSTWELFAARARDICSPSHVLELNISCSHLGFWKQELAEIVSTSLYDDRHMQHLFPEFKAHDQVLVWHIDLMDRLLQTRAQSLAVFHCLPPNLYNHLLAPSPQTALSASELALTHWKKLLKAEEAELAGEAVKPLKTMFWRFNPLVRTLFMSYEQDAAKGKFLSIDSAALRLQRVIAKNLGDSRVIENVHQHGRDLYRASKAKSISNTAIMANCLRSGVLEQRQVPMITADAVQKALGETWKQSNKEGVVKSMRSKGNSLPLELQKLMMAQKGDHSWPSPAAGTLFQSVMSTHWLFYYWENEDAKLKKVDVNGAWLSFLARPGSILAQNSDGLLVKVLASAEFGFLGLRMKVIAPGVSRFYCCSQGRDHIMFHHIWDLEDWIELQVEPCLVGGHSGPVGWQRTADGPLPLHVSALVHGHAITFQQAMGLLKMFGGAGDLPANPSKKVVMQKLIAVVVPDALVEQALSHLQTTETKDDQLFDSDFSELLSELGQDENNLQDLKEYREKKKFYKMKRRMNAKDQPIPKRKPRGKAKAKGKAKAAGKAKAVGKAKGDLGCQFRHRASRFLRKRKEEEEGMDCEQALEQALDEVGGRVASENFFGEPGAMDVEVAELGQEAVVGEAMEQEEGEPRAGEGEVVAKPSAIEGDAGAMPGGAGGANPKAKAKALPEGPRAERRRSPEELMALIEPPGCHMGISFNVHTFTSNWHKDHPELPGVLSQRSFSRAFFAKRTWRDALFEVHQHNWRKWKHLEKEYPLGDRREMVPGQIPDSIMEQFQPIIDSLPEYVRYNR